MPQTPHVAPDRAPGASGAPEADGAEGADAADRPAGPDGEQGDDALEEPHPVASTAATDAEGTAQAPDGPPRAPVARSATTSLLTWGTVALLLVIVVVLVVLKLTGSTPTTTTTATPPPQPAPSSVIQAVTSIPGAAYDAVGVTSPDEAVAAPTALHGQPAFRIGTKPGLLFVGGVFSPYSAAERWSLVAALSRFGKWSLLPAAQSALDEVFPSTPTFSFAGARYSSRYIGVRLVELYGNQKNGAGTRFAALDRPTAVEHSILVHYDKATGSQGGVAVPFIDVDNQMVQSGSAFSPAALEQLTMSEIASGLSDPKDPATQAILAGANYLSAAICAADGGQPASVCTSRGVVAAATALQQG